MKLNDIKEIAVIGGGTMGPGMAHSFAQHRFRVRLCDTRAEALKTARSVIRTNLKTLSTHQIVRESEIEEIESRVSYTSNLEEALAGAEFAVECITEDREAKRGLFNRMDSICPKSVIFASNTSYLNIFELVAPDRLPNTVIAHWFAPPHILPLVEVVGGSQTKPETVKTVVELLKGIGKAPVIMKKYVPGLAINRILRIIGREVFYLLDNGYITADQLDLAVKASIAPRMMLLGLVQRYDFTGLDLSAKNLQNEQFPEPPIDNEPKELFNLVRQGNLGVKTGKGFYDYGGKSLESILRDRDDGLLKILKAVGLV